jgi:hypothetical protein
MYQYGNVIESTLIMLGWVSVNFVQFCNNYHFSFIFNLYAISAREEHWNVSVGEDSGTGCSISNLK